MISVVSAGEAVFALLTGLPGVREVGGESTRWRQLDMVRPDRPPHVLTIIQNLPLRLDRRVRSECRALTDAGYRVSVICPKENPGDPDVSTVDQTTVYSYPAPAESQGAAAYVREFAYCWLQTARLSRRVHRDAPFDIIQTCNPPDTYWALGLLWKLARGVRFVFDQHDLCPEVFLDKFGKRGLLYRLTLLFERFQYRVADRVISTNESYRQVALERGHIDPSRSAVVMSTPDAEVMRRGPVDPSTREGFKHLVVYVGIMGWQDGVDRLLAAADEIVNGQGRADVRFALLGYGDSLAHLRAESTRLGLDGNVVFTGRVDHEEIGRWLSSADVGVTPDPPSEFNDRSTMNKTLEYMAHEIPVVATDLTETRRSAGDAAVYVPGGDPVDMAKAVLAVLEDPEKAARMGAIGRQRIVGELSWRQQARTYVSVFDAVVDATISRHRRRARAHGLTPAAGLSPLHDTSVSSPG